MPAQRNREKRKQREREGVESALWKAQFGSIEMKMKRICGLPPGDVPVPVPVRLFVVGINLHSALGIQLMPNEFFERLINQSSHSTRPLTTALNSELELTIRAFSQSSILTFSHSRINRHTSEASGSSEGQPR